MIFLTKISISKNKIRYYRLYGGFSSNVFLTHSAAYYPFFVGGNRILNLTVVSGLNTLPAQDTLGIPSIPVTVKVGVQHLFK